MFKLTIGLLFLLAVALSSLYYVGTQLTRPTHSRVTKPKTKIPINTIRFMGVGNIQLNGWLAKNSQSTVGVLLMHGNQSNRLSMWSRAEFLYKAGYSVMLFDLRAHGESEGDYKTFGYLEAEDAEKAVRFFKQMANLKRVGIIGTSLGGAAAVLNDHLLPVEAMILESVYPTIEKAVTNRINGRFGEWVTIFSPLLTNQLPLRFDIDTDALRPVKHMENITLPTLVIGGDQDQRTTLDDTNKLYQNINSREKSLWIIPGVAHENFHTVVTQEYEQRVLAFFNQYLPIE